MIFTFSIPFDRNNTTHFPADLQALVIVEPSGGGSLQHPLEGVPEYV